MSGRGSHRHRQTLGQRVVTAVVFVAAGTVLAWFGGATEWGLKSFLLLAGGGTLIGLGVGLLAAAFIPRHRP